MNNRFYEFFDSILHDCESFLYRTDRNAQIEIYDEWVLEILEIMKGRTIDAP